MPWVHLKTMILHSFLSHAIQPIICNKKRCCMYVTILPTFFPNQLKVNSDTDDSRTGGGGPPASWPIIIHWQVGSNPLTLIHKTLSSPFNWSSVEKTQNYPIPKFSLSWTSYNRTCYGSYNLYCIEGRNIIWGALCVHRIEYHVLIKQVDYPSGKQKVTFTRPSFTSKAKSCKPNK